MTATMTEHRLLFSSGSWHARWYRTWLRLGGKPPAYRENLCHYVRVLLFWAPCRWVFFGTVRGWTQPWKMIAAVAAVVFVALYSAFVSLRLLAAIGSVLAAIALLVAIASVAVWIEDHPKGRLSRTFKAIGRLLTIVSRPARRPLLAGLRLAGTLIEEWGFGILVVAIVLMLAAIYAKAMYEHTMPVLIITAAAAVLSGAVAAGVTLSARRKKRRQQSNAEPASSPIRQAATTTAETVKLRVAYIDNKKKGSLICPFIEFDDRPAA